MAIGWMTILKSVPWTEVIANSPKIAEGARKLWQATTRKPPPEAEPAASPAGEMAARLAAAEAAVADLHAQMLASSGLIRDLAEQNARLIEGIGAVEARLRRLAWLCLVLAVAAVAALVLALWR